MSLVRAALRIAVVRALRYRTLADGNVLDSEIGVIETGEAGTAETRQKKPFISVYAGSGESSDETLTANGETWLALELGVTAAMAAINEDTGESEIVPGIPATDDALELTLDLMAREITNALTDPSNPWSEIYRGLVVAVLKIEVEPLRAGDTGQRLAARQIRFKLLLIDDPVLGAGHPDEGALGPFLHALEMLNEPIAASQADLIRTAIGSVDDRDWRVEQRRRGLTAASLLSLGLGPVQQDKDRATPVMTAAIVDDAIAGVTEIDF